MGGLHYRPKSEVLQAQLGAHHEITWNLYEAWVAARAKLEMVEEPMSALNMLQQQPPPGLEAERERKRVERAFRRVWHGRGPY